MISSDLEDSSWESSQGVLTPKGSGRKYNIRWVEMLSLARVTISQLPGWGTGVDDLGERPGL